MAERELEEKLREIIDSISCRGEQSRVQIVVETLEAIRKERHCSVELDEVLRAAAHKMVGGRDEL